MRGYYIQILDKIVIEGIILPALTILDIIDTTDGSLALPIFEYDQRKYVVHCKYKELTSEQCALYLEEIIILRSCRLTSICGEYIIKLEVGELLYVDGFTESGEVFTRIDDYDYEIDDSQFTLYKVYRELFTQLTPVSSKLTSMV